MNLSPNFKLEEFLKNDHNIKLSPIHVQIQSIIKLCNKVLEPIRKEFNYPLKITSGLRNNELNSLVKGSIGSHHLYGMAADFWTLDFYMLLKMYIYIITNLKFTQVILYNNKKSFIHVSYDENNLKCQPLVIEEGVKYNLANWLYTRRGIWQT